MERHPLQSPEGLAAIQECADRRAAQMSLMKSPEQDFQENIKIAEDAFNSLRHSSDNSNDIIDEIMGCGTRIKELRALHKDTKEQKEQEHQNKLYDNEVPFFIDLLALFDLEVSKRLSKLLCDKLGHPIPTTTAPSDTIPGAVDTHQPEDTTASRFAPTQDLLTQPTSTNDSVPSRPDAESAGEPSTRPNELHRLEQNASSGTSKRPVDSQRSPESRPTRPTKRVRSDIAQGPLTGDRTIEFDQVYQNGHAEPKYVIVKHGEFWYILECKKHRLHFNNHPIRGAVKHLRGKKHNQTSVNFEDAIRALGTRVLHCTDDNVAENNEVARRPSYSEMGQPVNSLSPSVAHSIPTRSNQNRAEIDPKPGEVYTTYWSETRKIFAILVLPWRNIGQLGKDLSLTVKDTELIKKIPPCYRYNHVDESYEWAPQYRPGGENNSSDQAVPDIDAGQGSLSDDPPTAEIFPREEQVTGEPGREIIVIDDDSDDGTESGEPWPDTPVGDPIPKTEPQEGRLMVGNAQQDPSHSHGTASSQQPSNLAVANHS
ncbi:hypothetical protein FPANT_2238 [Fusarium pseudoanthophilum]|uniref:Uncharacterized protein n=1 Tax=Fusarium pseudoanthophilum TaxID=48495 RepID=A0A8H5UX15_9HYPO|nr:hypothetical protein FPANT_2238 [Fusarium pseudoanthophilum]